MFADSAKIFIKSGKGGDGHVSFRRELYVPNGGPDGGDGGRGGDIIFQVDEGLNTLSDFRHVRKYVAQNGEEGKKRKCHGADGKDLVIKVPAGTVIKDDETGKVIVDMSGDRKREILLKGGRGGQGNMHYATATMQVPKYAQPGKAGRELWVRLELKVIADVGLVGFPNVGKSTFLSRVTNARPKIANYHFTTLNPVLGVVDMGEGSGFVIADIPGLIDVADNGIGMPPEVAESLLDPDRPQVRTGGSGTGVRNVHQRIRLTFGAGYGLTIFSEPDEGTLVRIRLPALTREEAARCQQGEVL